MLISTNGGTKPLWARSGDELFYLAANGTIESVRVDGSSSWRSSTPMKVLQADYFLLAPSRTFDIAPDGKRFLMIKAGGDQAPPPPSLIIVENWFEELKRLVPTN